MMFKKSVEVLAKEFQYEPLPVEVRGIIVAAWTRGGMLSKASADTVVPTQN